MNKTIVTTSWDDGHKLDIKLAALLKKYKIKGTFYVSSKNREFSRKDLLNNVDLLSLSKDFEIGAHTLTHPDLSKISKIQAEREILSSKVLLEKRLKKKISSFCYPYGSFTNEVKKIVKSSGFLLARTTKRYSTMSKDVFEMGTSVHTYGHFSDLLKIAKISKFNPITFVRYTNWENLAKAMFDEARQKGEIFHLWGHSWEIEKNNDWEKLENVLKYISRKENVLYKTNGELRNKDIRINKVNKIIIISPYFFPKTGGLENYVYNIAKGLKKTYKLEVVIITSNHKEKKDIREIIDGIKVYRLAPMFKISNTPINPFWFFDIKRIVKIENPDIINAHSPVPFIADIASLTSGKIPFVLTYHAGSMEKERFLFDLIIHLYQGTFLKMLLKKADKIICSSKFVKNTIANEFSFKSTVITPGVDTSLFKPNKDIQKDNTVLFIGKYANMYPMKGLPYLIDAVKNLDYVNLKVIGEKIETKQKNVKYLGIKDRIGIVKEIQKSKVLVLPSLPHMESFGMALIEGMACKIPVIGTRSGGIPEIINTGKNGLLVRPKKSRDLQMAIKRIFKDKYFAKKIARNGYKKVLSKFTWKIKINETYNELMNI